MDFRWFYTLLTNQKEGKTDGSFYLFFRNMSCEQNLLYTMSPAGCLASHPLSLPCCLLAQAASQYTGREPLLFHGFKKHEGSSGCPPPSKISFSLNLLADAVLLIRKMITNKLLRFSKNTHVCF